jgi:hypothetical protein
MSHKAADEVHVAAETVQLGDSDVARGGECGLELRSSVNGIFALAGLHLNELTGQFQALGLRELLERPPLRFDTKT